MKKALLWLLQAHFYLIPFALLIGGIFLFVMFVPNHAALLSIIWVLIISFLFIKYNRWY